tara:strand:+ start:3023 stop:3715 length:693 start_codon:yes stop_codon:yes gene_type:complete
MYIPKTHITPNLYTNGGEYQIASNGQEYVGDYWQYANNKLYTGATPYSPPPSNQLIIPITTGTWSDDDPIITISRLALAGTDPDPVSFPTTPDVTYKYVIQEGENFNYNLLFNNSTTPIPINKIVPNSEYVSPTPEDYNFQEYMRYFLYQTNPIHSFFEVSKNTYNNILNKSSQYMWEFFTPISLPWRLVGTRDEVYKVNFEVVKSQSNFINIPYMLTYFEGKYDQYRKK